MNFKKDYSETILEKREKLNLFGFKSSKEDAQLMATIINILANENNMTIYRASSILEDATRLLPLIGTI